MKEDGSERRVKPRIEALLRIDYHDLDEFAVDYLIDLSEGGLFIRTNLKLETGEFIDFAVSFPGLLEPIELRGVVRHVSQDKEQPGLGVEFVFKDEKTKKAVAELVKQIQETEPNIIESQEYRILIVDDNPLVLELFSYALTSQGLGDDFPSIRPDIITASNGQEALKILNSQHIDFLILDHYMPKMDGVTLLRILRENPKLASIPVLMVSVEAEEVKISCLRSGADLFISKPIQARPLLQTLSSLLGNAKKKGETE